MDTTAYGPAGADLIMRIEADLAERQLQLDPLEEAHLDQAARLLDRLRAVQAKLRRGPMVVTNAKSGATKANPLLSEERQLMTAISRLLGKLDLNPTTTVELTPAQKFRREQKGHGGRASARARGEGGGR
jgi:phage terminase small subunit